MAQALDIKFTVDPTNVTITDAELDAIQNQITADIAQIVSNNNYGMLAWLEVGGYAKWAKAS